MSGIDFDKFDLEGLSLEDMEPVKKAESIVDDIPQEAKPVEVPEVEAKPVEIDESLSSLQRTENADVGGEEAAKDSGGSMTCPKCELEQPKAEQCSGCGVYVKKAQAQVQAQGKSKIQITSAKF